MNSKRDWNKRKTDTSYRFPRLPWGGPQSKYALRVGGWVNPKAYSRGQDGWDGKDQSVRTIQSIQKSENLKHVFLIL